MNANSRWQASKIGLINFWYYDDQEFPFVKGRMLLRGSNGSGKSVTMQSVVPLLLDGNMSPERLDPFGSRDRKMNSYLLEEDDGREERIGYLYLEFKRSESEHYLTIGMGIRARRGKPLDKWYFSLTDGRRVGVDFFLFKEMGEKVTLSRRELENRIGAGGQIFDRQAEYMEYVNRQIFGFETVDEYKEMIDLLIQLRTPKLSKDFKPSVINDILSDSLQPLSDDDLRPMSEAIENMDQMTMNLKSREEAKQAAEKIQRVYDKYNQLVLYEKAEAYREVQQKLEQLEQKEAGRQRQMAADEREITDLNERLQQMDAKHASMEKERETLSKSDAVNLKTREAELEQEAKRQQQMIDKKQEALAAKEELYRDVQSRQRSAQNRKDLKEQELTELLDEMQEQAEIMGFEEHAFFRKEFEEHLAEPFSFAAHGTQFVRTKGKIHQAYEILRETNLLEPKAEKLLQRRDECLRELDGIHKQINDREMLLVQAQNEWKEALYKWNGQNRQLVLDKEQLKQCCHFADSYGLDEAESNESGNDFSRVREMVSDVRITCKNKLDTRLYEKSQLLDEKRQEQAQQQQELTEWENAKDPEPERSEGVLKNRARLDELHIPYQEFYKVIEFSDQLGEDACNRLEEALLQMGILDALVIEEEYREQVLAEAPGCEDRYLFVQHAHCEKSLLDVLELNDSVNDIFSNQRLTGILSEIAYGEDSVVSVAVDGSYRMGVLMGTVTGEHVAGFLGTRARERNRRKRMEQCRERLAQLEAEIALILQEQQVLEQQKAELEEEYAGLPTDYDLRTARKMLMEQREAYGQKQRECDRVEQEWKELAGQIREMKKRALELAEQLYLNCTYTVFQEAAVASSEYEKQLVQLRSSYELLLESMHYIQEQTDRLEEIDADMDDIRYDLSGAKKQLTQVQAEHASIVEQLKLTDYEQIKDRLDACLHWLKEEYPVEWKNCEQRKAQLQEELKTLEQQTAEGAQQKQIYEQRGVWRRKCYESELALGYVALPEQITPDAANVCGYLSTDMGTLGKDAVITSLNQVYFENRAYLSEYQVMQNELFGELETERPTGEPQALRQDFTARYQGTKIPFTKLLSHLEEDIAQLQDLIKSGDRELFEDILANTVSRKIRGKINASNAWVEKMNTLMGSMNTSSGLKLSLRWRSRTAEAEDQLDTKELVELLKKDYRLMSESEAARLSAHFRSKVEEARRHAKDNAGMVSFYQVMKETLDYRRWFEFQLFSQKSGERVKELTNSVFGTFSGGEKAMSMYVPLFSAVVAKYQGGRADAPRLISLDEAFAGVDNRNIRDMFRLMTEFSFDFIINSQVLWGDCDTLDALAIYQLIRPENAKFVTVMPYLWNGRAKELLENEQEVEARRTQLA